MLRNFTNLQRHCITNPIKSALQNTRRCNSILVLKIQGSNFHSASKISNITYNLQSALSKKFQHTKAHEDTKLVSGNDFNSFTYRTHTCGELRPENDGQKVILCGWVQFVRLSKFILLRDAYGITQCIAGNKEVNLSNIPLETVLKVKGTVVTRPTRMVNSKMATGEIEVVIDTLDILNTADKVPFTLRDYQKPKEQLRLQHRYIDLRFPEIQSNLRLRSNMLHNMRRFLVENHGFVEVETPTLFCRTPGGAREFVVPTRHSGLFYSLVQSPQQFKQMLMSGGIDRYFQIARCYRDESTRPDRQPEFTQLDLELSFTSQDGVLALIENLLYDTFPKNLPKPPLKRMTYREAIENYGTDKPNLAYDLKLLNIKKFFPDKEYEAYILPFPSELQELPTDFLQQVVDLTVKYVTNIILPGKLRKEFGSFFIERIKEIIGEENTCIVCLGRDDTANLCLGELRESLAKILKEKKIITVDDNYHPLWVVDFPLFTKGENGLETCHHPFTAPHPDDIHLLDTEPLKMRSLAYDLVLNGNEIGGGSVRIHNVELQEKILTLLNIEKESLSHFLNALKHGCPPHAGIALGIDRLTSCLCNAESIRDVIAFPKSHDGKDPLSGAPNKISDNDKKYYHLSSVK